MLDALREVPQHEDLKGFCSAPATRNSSNTENDSTGATAATAAARTGSLLLMHGKNRAKRRKKSKTRGAVDNAERRRSRQKQRIPFKLCSVLICVFPRLSAALLFCRYDHGPLNGAGILGCPMKNRGSCSYGPSPVTTARSCQ